MLQILVDECYKIQKILIPVLLWLNTVKSAENGHLTYIVSLSRGALHELIKLDEVEKISRAHCSLYINIIIYYNKLKEINI